MYKKLMLLLVLAVAISAFSACAIVTSPVGGSIYLDVHAPHSATAADAAGDLKVGEGIATSILGIVGTGDASVNTAMNAGGIQKIHFVDYHSWQILGLYGVYTVKVYGE